jgi:hypothetical protein
MRLLLALVLLMPLAAQAQDLAQDLAQATRLEADLDGDGRAEVFSLTAPSAEGFVDLVVETASGTIRVPEAAWSGPMAGQEAWLELSEAGSPRLVSGNEGVGRGRWSLTVTIAHRGGRLVVAGLTETWRDTLDPTAWGRCDLNLLAGRGQLDSEAGPRDVPAPPPLALADWAAGAALPPSDCGAAR